MVSAVLEFVVVLALGLVLYSYVLYPLVLCLVAGAVQLIRDVRFVFGKRDRRIGGPLELPDVAVVIAAFNEEVDIAARVENLLALDYPVDRLHIHIGSDGSTDATNSILSGFRDSRLHVSLFEENRGKASVLNDLVDQTVSPLIVFSDANTMFEPQALRRLVAHFEDDSVGAVSGELHLTGNGGDNQDGLYWRVEQMLKFFEGRIGGLLGANGAIYAIRRQAWQRLRVDTICDDFCVAMTVAAQGYRLVYEPSARAEESIPERIADEYRRRIRIGIGNFQALVRHPEYLFGVSRATAFAYFSHKVLRWLTPHLVILGMLSAGVLAIDSSGWLWFSACLMAGFVVAVIALILVNRGVRLPQVLRLLAFFTALNWAFLVASWRFATGRFGGAWSRTRR